MLLTNLKIATMDATVQGSYGGIDGGAIEIAKGEAGAKINWVGHAADAPEGLAIDCGGRLVTPGLIDCHTHIVYGGNRAQEFEQRLNGVGYAEIAKAGGGILSTVAATRATSEDDLLKAASRRLTPLLAEGVTTIEIKSGYGLDVETELKMLRVARRIGAELPIDVRTAYLGAHTFPKEYQASRAGYVRLICEQALPALGGLADAVDGFCETIAFTVDEMRTVFTAARQLGLPVKLHAEQLSNLGGARLAAEFGALSVDHIEYLDAAGIEAIAAGGTVAVLLPGAFYYLREKQAPPVAGLRSRSVPIAIATDLNPGSSPVHSLLTVMNMACVLFGLTPEEALRGVTVNAARALGLADRGRIAPGLRADLAFWEVERPGDLAYPLGFNPCAGVMRNGEWVGERPA